MEQQVTNQELLDFRARVESYHNSKDVLLPDEVRKSYLESLCKTHQDKAKFKALYGELFPDDAETLAELDKMMKKEQEQYPKDVAEAMVIAANDMGILFARAFKNMLELSKGQKEKQSSLSVDVPERRIAVSEIDYDGISQTPQKPAKKQKRPSFFARRRERKQNKMKQIETVSPEQIKKEKISAEQKQLEDKRLEMYNANVKQRGLANQRSFAMQKSNDRVMSK